MSFGFYPSISATLYLFDVVFSQWISTGGFLRPHFVEMSFISHSRPAAVEQRGKTQQKETAPPVFFSEGTRVFLLRFNFKYFKLKALEAAAQKRQNDQNWKPIENNWKTSLVAQRNTTK